MGYTFLFLLVRRWRGEIEKKTVFPVHIGRCRDRGDGRKCDDDEISFPFQAKVDMDFSSVIFECYIAGIAANFLAFNGKRIVSADPTKLDNGEAYFRGCWHLWPPSYRM